MFGKEGRQERGRQEPQLLAECAENKQGMCDLSYCGPGCGEIPCIWRRSLVYMRQTHHQLESPGVTGYSVDAEGCCCWDRPAAL